MSFEYWMIILVLVILTQFHHSNFIHLHKWVDSEEKTILIILLASLVPTSVVLKTRKVYVAHFF